MTGRIMALDVGDRTIGVALSDLHQMMGFPHTTIRRTVVQQDLVELQKLIREQDVVAIVVGMPRSLSGELAFQAERTARFIEQMRQSISLPVELWDERFSTAEADRMFGMADVPRARRRAIVDQAAASIILQGFLSRRRSVLLQDSHESP